MATPFDFGLGQTQGRIQATGAPEGSYVFELGHAFAKTQAWLSVGDYSEISQDVTHETTEVLIRFAVKVTEPSTSNPNVAWDLIGKVDGSEFVRRRIEFLGRSMILTDLGLSIYGKSSPTTITFRLEAVTP